MRDKVDKIDEVIGGLKQDTTILKEDVSVLKEDVNVLKEDVTVLKEDVVSLKENDFERTVREKAPAYLGRLFRRCRLISFEALADKLEDAVDTGLIAEKDKDDAFLIDAVVTGKLKTGKDVMLAVEVSLKVDIDDIQRASRRAEIVNKAYNVETIGVAIGKERTNRSEIEAEQLNVLLV